MSDQSCSSSAGSSTTMAAVDSPDSVDGEAHIQRIDDFSYRHESSRGVFVVDFQLGEHVRIENGEEIFRGPYPRGSRGLLSAWYVRKNGESRKTHVGSIFWNTSCDEDELVVSSREHQAIVEEVMQYICDKVGHSYYAHYNTIKHW